MLYWETADQDPSLDDSMLEWAAVWKPASLTQGLPRIKTVREEKRRRALGAELFLLYVRLNELLVAGDDIISQLERYVRYPGPGVGNGDDAYFHSPGPGIAKKLARQQVSLSRTVDLLADNGAVQRSSRPTPTTSLRRWHWASWTPCASCSALWVAELCLLPPPVKTL